MISQQLCLFVYGALPSQAIIVLELYARALGFRDLFRWRSSHDPLRIKSWTASTGNEKIRGISYSLDLFLMDVQQS